MPGIVSVERVDLTIANGNTANQSDLSLGQDDSKCVPFATFQHNATSNGSSDNFTANMAEVEIYDNAGTAAVRITRTATTDPLVYTIYVVEFDSDVTVQRGEVNTISGTGTNVTVTSVDQTKTFALFYYKRESGDADAFDSASVRAYFTADNTLRLNRSSSADGTFSGWWYVVEDDASNWDVESGSISLTGTSATDTISAVTTAKTFVVASQESTQIDDDAATGSARVDLQSTTLVRAIRNASDASTITVSHFAVEFASGGDENVYRGLMSFTTESQLTGSHTAVDSDVSCAWSPLRYPRSAAGGGTQSSDVNTCAVKVIINGTDNGVVADRSTFGPSLEGCDFAWNTIEWAVAAEVADNAPFIGCNF
jgi:hypothetical protein